MELGLKGRTAVLVGGSMGIGKAAARGLAAEGVNVVLLARGKEHLDKSASEIASKRAFLLGVGQRWTRSLTRLFFLLLTGPGTSMAPAWLLMAA